MGKRLISQRRGRGTNTFKAKLKGINVNYAALNDQEKNYRGEVISLEKESGRNAIIAKIKLEGGTIEELIAAEGLRVGQVISHGKDVKINVGNIGFLRDLPEGCPIFSIEKRYGDGGTIARNAGSYALLITKDKNRATIKLPSKKLIKLPLDVRATIGNASSGGRRDKPVIKAGNRYYAMKAKKKLYPTVRGVAMNAVDHPFGGAQHHPGKSKSVSRNAPPGRKVGAIASKRTGRRKKN